MGSVLPQSAWQGASIPIREVSGAEGLRGGALSLISGDVDSRDKPRASVRLEHCSEVSRGPGHLGGLSAQAGLARNGEALQPYLNSCVAVYRSLHTVPTHIYSVPTLPHDQCLSFMTTNISGWVMLKVVIGRKANGYSSGY